MSTCEERAAQQAGEEDHCLHDHEDGCLVCCWCGDLFIHPSEGEAHGRFRPWLGEQVLDLKARLKAVRGPQPAGYIDEAEAWERILRITDLRRKNWMKP